MGKGLAFAENLSYPQGRRFLHHFGEKAVHKYPAGEEGYSEFWRGVKLAQAYPSA